MLAITRAPNPTVVQQHAEDAATLRTTRSYLVSAPHVRLHQLRRLDDRLAAHLDGLAIAGEYGSTLATAALERPERGQVFTASVRAIEDRDPVGLGKLLAMAEALPAAQAGVISAFGWVSAASLRGITKALLESPQAFRRQVGLAACAMHQVDGGRVVLAALEDADIGLRSRALRVTADQGQVHLLPACLNAMADEDDRVAYEAARAAVFLGDRRASVAALDTIAAAPGPWRSSALGLTLKLHSSTAAHAVLQALSQDPGSARLLVHGIGAAGDPYYVPWLIRQMQDVKLARLAGETFSLITGLDLAAFDLERKSNESVEPDPNDDPNDDKVAMDEDDSLPWPDPEKIGAWWQSNGHRFSPRMRYFMGEPLSPAHCLSVLKAGFQRQRMAAAVHLCLMKPGTPLFNTAAPAWRQQRWLDAMDA